MLNWLIVRSGYQKKKSKRYLKSPEPVVKWTSSFQEAYRCPDYRLSLGVICELGIFGLYPIKIEEDRYC